MSALPSLFFNEEYEDKLLRKYPNTFKNLLKNFRVYKQKTAIEKNINDYYNISRFVGPDAPGVEAEPAEVYRRMGARVYDFDQWMLNAQN